MQQPGEYSNAVILQVSINIFRMWKFTLAKTCYDQLLVSRLNKWYYFRKICKGCFSPREKLDGVEKKLAQIYTYMWNRTWFSKVKNGCSDFLNAISLRSYWFRTVIEILCGDYWLRLLKAKILQMFSFLYLIGCWYKCWKQCMSGFFFLKNNVI